MDAINTDRWQLIKQIAGAALDLEAASRDPYLAQACAGDPGLGDEVRSLLAATTAAEPYFETPGGGGGRAALYWDGSQIGSYRIVRELASGGMGSVYLAERAEGDFYQRAAIKIIRGGFANSFLLERFREERRILASLDHPNIAHLLDGGATGTGLPYVVMEFVEGVPIDRFCEDRALSLRDRITVFQQVCAAVQYAHQHLVIHRDIKAANILVTDEGVPKLLDFGIAKLLDPNTATELTARTTVRIMTPESASPEQLSGHPVTVAADVYSLGVLLYRLLTGVSPYRATRAGDTELIREVCEETPDRPSARPPIWARRVPPDLDMIVMKALRKEPERRYQSAGQFSEDLQRFLDGRAVIASPDTVRYRARKFVARHRLAMAAAAALAVAISAGVATSVWEARVALRERARAEREFNAVRGLAQAVTGELHDAVVKLPGSTAAQEILLRRATEYLDALSPEAREDATLRREVASGYVRLSVVQGQYGLPNVGDRAGSRSSLAKAVALLTPVAGPEQGTLEDRLYLAFALCNLAMVEGGDGVAGAAHIGQAKAIVEALTPTERSSTHGITARLQLWSTVANTQIAAHNYSGARESQQQVVEAAREAIKANPENLGSLRNLSLAYKQLGALLEVLHRRPEAMPLYEEAQRVDERRVAADPKRPLWQLDLSFAHGAIGSALQSSGDLHGALARYEQAVALREAVVKADPDEDFAKTSLARGYERLAEINQSLGDVSASLTYRQRQLQVYLDRLASHPERDNVWHEYAEAAAGVLGAFAGQLSAPTLPSRSRLLIKAQALPLLDRVAALQGRWVREKRAGVLPPDAAHLEALRARIVR